MATDTAMYGHRGGADFLAIEKDIELFFYPLNPNCEYYLDIKLDEKGHYPVIQLDTMIMKLLDAYEEGKIQRMVIEE